MSSKMMQFSLMSPHQGSNQLATQNGMSNQHYQFTYGTVELIPHSWILLAS